MKNFVLEVCVESVESASEAVRGGGTRLELCANLVIGGTTPSIFLFQEIRKQSDIPIHAIIRPRFGDFCYTSHELRIMAEEIKQFRKEGVEGVVIGALSPDGCFDMDVMESLCAAAGGMNISIHRAFDVCRDPFEALEQANHLGVGTILTSGQKKHCLEGVELIKELAALGKVDIMAGAGVSADIIRELRVCTGISSYHLSGKKVVDSPMIYRNTELSMGLPSLSEYELWRTDVELISAARRVLEEID